MVVEFIGTPGAGKTTLLPTVIAALDEQGIKAFTIEKAARAYAERTLPGQAVGSLAPRSVRQPLLWRVFYYASTIYRLRFFARHPKLIWMTVDSQRCRPQGADVRERKVLHWFFRLVGYYEFLRSHARPDEALLLDEGFVHRVVQFNASGAETPSPAQISSYIDLLPQPDLIIYAYAPPQVCQDRMYSRGLWERFQRKDAEEISQFVANAHAVVRLTVNHIRRKGWTVIEVDNGNDDLAGTQEELSRQLAQLFRQAGPQSTGKKHRQGRIS